MKKTIIFLLALCVSSVLFGQDKATVAKTIKGKVVNANSNRPVSYTNIGLEGTFYGTASDEEGNFELKIPEEMVGKNIYFSAGGFDAYYGDYEIEVDFGDTVKVFKIPCLQANEDSIFTLNENDAIIEVTYKISVNNKGGKSNACSVYV